MLDIGLIQATAERQPTLRLPPVLGIVAVVCGGALLIPAARRNS